MVKTVYTNDSQVMVLPAPQYRDDRDCLTQMIINLDDKIIQGYE